ncbi:MAG: hypothetical protein E5Y02_05210 [Mesorhizobium sp.]|nr:MAG: hypothetical protein E5Y06_02530 [Mesorhizobium sp.]TJU86516.1 MAG: hypothetical protein E5Y12_31915 [Mesorhizobium sp.]TJV01303.1 MAG: hypothetical protein E5Y08_01965 [Mesorhizobium sp.]TJV19914.1 MAG: hypothetical protein E5Y07_01655 [Mesorhizobium sp.]TJV45129.1 MAG: hypothetical protein E5Y02_05210 [Mesorhizobium sp.]
MDGRALAPSPSMPSPPMPSPPMPSPPMPSPLSDATKRSSSSEAKSRLALVAMSASHLPDCLGYRP